MIRKLSLILLFIGSYSIAHAQSNLEGVHTTEVEIDGEKKELQVLYEYKVYKNETEGLRVKFKNKTKSALTVELELGIYSNGVLLEKSNIVDCLKKSFSDNITRPVHIVQSDALKNDDISIEILNLISEPIDECRETHSE